MLKCLSSSSMAREYLRPPIARRCSGCSKTRTGTAPLPLPIHNVSGGSVSHMCSLFPSSPSLLSVARSLLCRCVALLVSDRPTLGTSTLVNSISFSPFSRTPVRLPMCLRDRSDSIRASVLPPFVAPVSLHSQRLNSYGAQQSFQQPSQQNGGGYNGQGY